MESILFKFGEWLTSPGSTNPLTAIMIVVAAWAANESRKMAKIMFLEYWQRNRPILGIDGVAYYPETGYMITVKNHGNSISKHSASACVDGKDLNLETEATREIITFPNAEVQLFLGSTTKVGSTVTCKILYWTPSNPKRKYETKKTFKILSQTVLTIEDNAT